MSRGEVFVVLVVVLCTAVLLAIAIVNPQRCCDHRCPADAPGEN